ncbi:hypothetical protein NESM_000439600 [Novymonas esmeraldas]|uniref:Uncharacterized protein n=1 Tax=Novymonas esmeraldas TaxID=1808958 RepID=A0AAW0EQR9_9TRYP
MLHTRCLHRGGVFETPLAELRRTARRVAHSETRRLQQKRATTNLYHKEQYVTAYLEAHSAGLVHQHGVSASSGAKLIDQHPTTSLTTSHELTALAQELDARYGSREPSTLLDRATGQDTRAADARTALSRGTAGAGARVEFGAWRSTSSGGDVRLQRRLRSADVMRHCVVREARTPPSLSPEVLERALPSRLPPAAQRLRTLVRALNVHRSEDAVSVVQLQSRVTSALRALHYSRELQRSLALYIVLCVTAFTEWDRAAALLVWLVSQWPTLSAATPPRDASASGETVCADRSLFIALFLDTARSSLLRPSFGAPSLEAVERVCCALHAACDTDSSATTSPSRSPRWDTVVSAPLLSLMGVQRPSDNADTHRSSETVQMKALARQFCMQRSRRRSATATAHGDDGATAGPAYMPAVAWAEYLRALHRCGASLAELQEATDHITDPKHTRHADELLSSTHVWNAYLACSPGRHAKEVYEANLRAYKVVETPATTAAVMTALLRDGTAEGTAEARALWKQLQQRHASGNMVAHTASTLAAYANLLAREGNADALGELLTSFEDLYETFGVSQDFVARASAEAREHCDTSAPLERGVAVLHRVCDAHPFLVPLPLRHGLVQAAAQVSSVSRASASAAEGVTDCGESGGDTAAPPATTLDLSADDLAAMM